MKKDSRSLRKRNRKLDQYFNYSHKSKAAIYVSSENEDDGCHKDSEDEQYLEGPSAKSNKKRVKKLTAKTKTKKGKK